MSSNYPKGSEWRQWDLHIHTPASFHWNGQKFKGDPLAPSNYPLVDEMINALNNAKPAVFALMDYWTFGGWFALKNRLKQADAPKLKKTVFPGIELRLMAPMKGRLNAHVIFSDEIKDQDLRDFKSNLKIEFPGQDPKNLSDDALIQFARTVATDKLSHHSLDISKVNDFDEYALYAGSVMAELNCDSYKDAIKKVPNDQAIGFMPFDTYDGLTDIARNAHYSYTLGLFKTSPIFETRKQESWEAFAGVKTDKNIKWIDSFQETLKNIPRLAVSGSDAHQFVGVSGDNDKRGYGDYPSGKITWIKADPTFLGLKQAIKEPAKRSCIGAKPSKLEVYETNKSQFIEAIKIFKNAETKPDIGKWLDETSIVLNSDLVAIIGNKGSGKSALADIIALLGNSKQSHHFSFLKKDRFRGRNGEPAKHFDAELLWADSTKIPKNLALNPEGESVELVKYIPQGHFEELCNAHVSGKSNAFETELRSVIFSHADESIRLGALNFDQLIDIQENSVREKLTHVRTSLSKLNKEITENEAQQEPEIRSSILQKVTRKLHVIDEIKNTKPVEVLKPTEELSIEQKSFTTKLTELAEKLKAAVHAQTKNNDLITSFSLKLKACNNLREHLSLLKRNFTEFENIAETDAKTIGLSPNNLAQLTVSYDKLKEIENASTEQKLNLQNEQSKLGEQILALKEKQSKLSTQLNAPQQIHQQYLEDILAWETKVSNANGNKDEPESLLGLKARLEQLDKIPAKIAEQFEERRKLTLEIFDILDEQRASRELLFSPVQELIQNNSLIRNEYKLKFKSEMKCTPGYFSSQLFELIKQSSGEFRGEEESFNLIVSLMDINDINTKEGVEGFTSDLLLKLHGTSNDTASIKSIMRKNKEPYEVYDLIYSLSFLTPRYTLLFQDAHIEQLSPGQRGALLLIFYLLVDKGSMPIILDQPEENLDNETIVSLLVPVLCKAKESRQIIMVTHNPNLAVVCDAEQIIHCDFNRKNDSSITYTTGAIESRDINLKIVNVLEGTMPAFKNREQKYNKD
ncbi:MAG: ABC transporter [Alteromonadaceae bacterium]|nr:ABC transporter [Alteromonadaceae bacterium]